DVAKAPYNFKTPDLLNRIDVDAALANLAAANLTAISKLARFLRGRWVAFDFQEEGHNPSTFQRLLGVNCRILSKSCSSGSSSNSPSITRSASSVNPAARSFPTTATLPHAYLLFL